MALAASCLRGPPEGLRSVCPRLRAVIVVGLVCAVASCLRGPPAELRAAAADFATTLTSRQSVAVDATAHARQARRARVGESKLRSSRVGQRQAQLELGVS